MAENQQDVKVEKFEGEVQDRGMFNFLEKKKEEEKGQGNVLVTEGGKVEESGKEGEEKKPGLMEKLHRTGSNSSSSSDEEVEVNGEKKKIKKSLKEKLAERMSGEKKPDKDTHVEVEKVDSTTNEKKGFVDKIKEKIPAGHQKKPEAPEKISPVPPPTVTAEEKEKEKGFLGKIMDKIPGYQKAEGGDQHQQSGATTNH